MSEKHNRSLHSTGYAGEFKNPEKFINQLFAAIKDEASAVEFYTVLEKETGGQYRDFVTHAKEDEMKHVRMFRRLYFKLTGHYANVMPAVTEFSSYRQGIEIAFRRELDAAERYRDMYLSTKNPLIRDVLFRAMTDEIEHAQRFSFLNAQPNI